MQTILSQNDWNQIILYENKRLQTVFTKDSLSLSCMKLKILLPVISRGMFPHWGKAPHQTLTPEVENKPLAQKLKLLLLFTSIPLRAPPAGSPLLLRCCLRRSRRGPPSWDDYEFPPHLRYCILSTLTPPISFLLFIRTGPLKLEIWTLSMVWRSRGSV